MLQLPGRSWSAGIVAAGALLLAFVGSSAKAIAAILPGDQAEVTRELWGCEEHVHDRLGQLADDLTAFRKLIVLARQLDQCTVFKPGTRLHVEGGQLFKQLMRVRAAGEIRSWWVTSAVLDENASRQPKSAAASGAPFRTGDKGTLVREALLCDWEAFQVVISFEAAADRDRYVRVAEQERRCKKTAPGAGIQVLETSWWYGAVKIQEVDGLHIWWIAAEALTDATAAR